MLIRHAQITADAAKAANEDFLAEDVTPKLGGVFRVSVVLGTAVKVRIVPSSGSAFYLRNGAALVANAVLTETFLFDARGGRTFNVQTDDGAGCTVQHLAVDEISEGA